MFFSAQDPPLSVARGPTHKARSRASLAAYASFQRHLPEDMFRCQFDGMVVQNAEVMDDGVQLDKMDVQFNEFSAKVISALTRRHVPTANAGSTRESFTFAVAEFDSVMYKNCKSWKVRSFVKEGDMFMIVGQPKVYDGYSMMRVVGGGAIEQQCCGHAHCHRRHQSIRAFS